MTAPSHLHTTQAFYDAIATEYAERYKNELAGNPMDRAVLAAFAERARGRAAGPVADLGCGPGRVTAHLHTLGLDVFGVDLSPAMVALARREHPDLRFDEGSLTALEPTDGTLGGIVAWYSLIHTPQEELPAVFAEFHRVLAPGGHLLVAFQAGDEPLHISGPFGHAVSLDFNRLSPDRITALLRGAGFTLHATTLREPEGGERVRQAYLMACKPERPWRYGRAAAPVAGAAALVCPLDDS
ncbi:methyltransferase domain-containing protein [Streptomyces sp. ET3-23]|uniref:class I SAM-dependent DNA methyltransferase n=1 Tax=Streptomyces sp. ET3-23 TaxID=2885643 RepID=UPI001D12C8BD|nr:class I SAM-dependent methyltransferase [Streptomyces sp. ET3-23]MCC2274185.1 methyltransferase domain-containing protein [Streptomyces sp. ET3-23]